MQRAVKTCARDCRMCAGEPDALMLPARFVFVGDGAGIRSGVSIMPMTKQDLQWFELRATLPEPKRKAVELAFSAAIQSIVDYGLKADMSDIAASFEASIIRFVEESNPA